MPKKAMSKKAREARASRKELARRFERLVAAIYRVKDQHQPQEIWFIVRAIELHLSQGDMLLEMACRRPRPPLSYFESGVKNLDDQMHDILEIVRPMLGT